MLVKSCIHLAQDSFHSRVKRQDVQTQTQEISVSTQSFNMNTYQLARLSVILIARLSTEQVALLQLGCSVGDTRSQTDAEKKPRSIHTTKRPEVVP